MMKIDHELVLKIIETKYQKYKMDIENLKKVKSFFTKQEIDYKVIAIIDIINALLDIKHEIINVCIEEQQHQTDLRET